MTDYKALCAELADALHGHTSLYEGHECELVTRARTALAQTEPEGVTDEEILALAESHEISYNADYGRVEYPFVEGHDMRDELLSYSRALIARSLELLPDDTTS
jgi:hypothetical protein